MKTMWKCILIIYAYTYIYIYIYYIYIYIYVYCGSIYTYEIQILFSIGVIIGIAQVPTGYLSKCRAIRCHIGLDMDTYMVLYAIIWPYHYWNNALVLAPPFVLRLRQFFRCTNASFGVCRSIYGARYGHIMAYMVPKLKKI